MTLQAVAGFLGQSGLQHPANLYRNFAGALAGKRSGFFRYNDFALTASGSNMSLQVGAGDAVLMGTEAVTTQGGYYVWNNATETLAWPASTSLPRVDSLILRVIDTDYGADPAGSKATWEIVSGTPAASPSAVADSAFAPAGTYYHPGAWLRVADFTVPASAANLAAATLSHKRKYARIGRHTMCLDTDFPADAQIGDSMTVLSGGIQGYSYFHDGSGWVIATEPGWQSYTPTYYSNVSTGATSITMTTTYSSVQKTGRTVRMIGSAAYSSGTSGSNFGISLPYTPSHRIFNAGGFYITGSGAPTNQTFHGSMYDTAPYNRMVITTINNSWLGVAAGQAVHWNLTYEANS